MSLLDSVNALHAGLDYHLARHNLLTANLTHLDTPNYRPLDLKRGPAFEASLNAAMSGAESGHSAGAQGKERFEVFEDPTATPGLDGNAVNVDREAAKIAANQVRYDALASLVGGELSGLAWAANDGK